MKYIDKLRLHTAKTITKQELEALFATKSDEDLWGIIADLENMNALSPVKSSHTNGSRKYKIYLKYRIHEDTSMYQEYTEEIETLHPKLLRNGILKGNLKKYAEYRNYINPLDRYLFSKEKSEVYISRKERSFEIFREEKVLEKSGFVSFLKKLGLDEDELRYYATPEHCFNDFIPEKKQEMTLLICENKDIWFNLRRMMFEENAKFLFDTEFDGVIYGEGNKVSENNAMTAYTQFLGGAKVNYLYWGDIDREGLNIFIRLHRNNPTLAIQLFTPAYEKMLELARGISVPDSEDSRGVMEEYTDIFAKFPLEMQEELKQSIEQNKRIPQEIISYAFLKKNMR